MINIDAFTSVVRSYFNDMDFIPLHAPIFKGNETRYVQETIESTMVSSVGKYVDQFENELSHYLNCAGATAVVNGTSGLQAALKLVGVQPGDEIITQSLTFVATVNSICLNYASPIFLDVDQDTMGLSPTRLEEFLSENTYIKNQECFNMKTGRRISCCLPMHTFGFLCRIEEIVEICNRYYIKVVEDAAEALGTFKGSQAAGTFGDLGVFSFNGNKVITSGGGGAIVSNNYSLNKKAKHITTTAKKPHPYEYSHDQIGYNFRMPNLNAALALAQLESIENYIQQKADLYKYYKRELRGLGFEVIEIPNTMSRWNYWLISIRLPNSDQRDFFLENTNKKGVMTRPIWKLMTELPMFRSFEFHNLSNSINLESTIVNIPSSAKL